MPWLLTFHIAALLCWCGALLYLPGLLIAQANATSPHKRLPYVVYTSIATPAALAAVIFGTGVFAVQGILDRWLIVKLMLVAVLVILHLLTGWLMVQIRYSHVRHAKGWCYVQSVLIGTTILAIFSLVLAKPLQGL